MRKSLTLLAGTALVAMLGATASVAASPSSHDAAPLGSKAGAFSLSVSNAKAAVGESATVTVRVTAGEGFKPNAEYPHKIKKLSADGAVKLAGKSAPGSVSGKSIVYRVQVTPTKAGAHTVTGQIRFSVCNSESCVIKKLPLNATVTGT